jgi:hypothetical protein
MAAWKFNFRNTRLGPPRYTSKGEAGLLWYAMDLIMDAFRERAFRSLLARYPDYAEDDMLALIAKDRRVVRGIDESIASWATRCKRWLDDAQHRGSPWMLMQKLSEYIGAGSSFRTVDAAGNWFSRSAAGVETYSLATGNWNWDNTVSASNWSRFWVIIYPGTRWTTSATWGSGQLWGDDEKTWGSTATAEQISTVRWLINEWKPLGTKCDTIIVAFDAASFNPASPEPDGLWGKWYKTVAGVAIPSRLLTARYADGV